MAVSNDSHIFEKHLTKTDLGLRGPRGRSNQAGPSWTRPKPAFPELDPNLENPRITLTVHTGSGAPEEWLLTLYNQYQDETKREFHLTNCRQYLESLQAVVGDVLRLERLDETEYHATLLQGEADAGDSHERRRISRGAGYASNPKDRVAIEDHSMQIAKSHYSDLGHEVDDTHIGNPFDLEIDAGTDDRFFVEVKGSRSDGEVVELTRNEVDHNRRSFPRTALFIVHGIKLRYEDGESVCEGGTVSITSPWSPDDADLTITKYRYRTGL
jgi:hypothetical protein